MIDWTFSIRRVPERVLLLALLQQTEFDFLKRSLSVKITLVTNLKIWSTN
jgi:hypothetical protein